MLEYHGVAPRSPRAIALAKTIGRLRTAAQLPGENDQLVELWGAERMWARRFAQSLWLYFRASEEFVDLLGVYDHVHEQ